MDEIYEEVPRQDVHRKTKKKDDKYVTRSFKLNNNKLDNLVGFEKVLDHFLYKPTNLKSLDLSMNQLETIDPALTQCGNLMMLYLHGNSINNLGEVEKLAELPTLMCLTLHGNPIEEEKRYRFIVVVLLPQLQTLDFSTVTKGDKATAKGIKGKPWIKPVKKESDSDTLL